MKPAKYYQGLLPLLKNYMLELAKGVEISATLVYEKLEKHCKRCLRLDHEEEDCPELRKEREERTQEAKQNFSPPRAEIGTKAPARVGSAEEKGRLGLQRPINTTWRITLMQRDLETILITMEKRDT